MENNTLTHHGILGMRWGVRRFQNKDGSLTAAGKKRMTNNTSDETDTTTGKKRTTNDTPDETNTTARPTTNKKAIESRKNDLENRRILSDDDLKKKIERLKLERELKTLTAEDITPGKKFASNVMSSAGQKALTTIATGALLYGTKVILTKKFDAKDAAGYVAPKPKNK